MIVQPQQKTQLEGARGVKREGERERERETERERRASWQADRQTDFRLGLGDIETEGIDKDTEILRDTET